jgi:uncharacterized protein (TIGR02217 family)
MFFEIEWPRAIGFTSQGGPTFSTQINLGFSGYEQRNRNWSASRAKYQLVLTGVPMATFQTLLSMFFNTGGPADAFRLYDPLDHAGSQEFIATGNGTAKVFQLQKTYTTGARSYARPIIKPITSLVEDFQGNFLTDTVKMFVNGAQKVLGADFTVDATTGLVTFTTAPASASTITSSFQFHVPCRFADDDPWKNASIDESDVQGGNGLVTVTQCALIEERITPTVIA